MIIKHKGIEYEKKDGMDFWIVKGLTDEFHSRQLFIPEEINGHPVTLIGKNAFCGNQEIKNVFLPDTIQIIGEHAFFDSQKISSVSLYSTSHPYTLPIRIMREAFANCVELYEVRFNKEADLVEAHLGSAGQFDGCPILRIFEADLVNIVPQWAFRYCLSLGEIRFSGNVEIKHNAFVRCDNLCKLVFKNGGLKLTPSELKFLKKKIICCTTNSNLADLAYEGYNIKII